MPVQARKRFGQHFLHDPAVIARLVNCIQPRAGDRLIEIGPGRGALTLPLLRAAGQLRVIEIDRDMPALLQRLCADSGTLDIISADALKVDFASLAAGQSVRIVGNLPYNISSPLLFHLLASTARITDMHFMLQQEVVDRMVAAPGTRDYGRLTVSIAARGRAEKLFGVGPGAFTPPPRVESAVVRLVPATTPPASQQLAALDRILVQAFSRRRKTLRNALSGLLDEPALAACGVDARRRPDTLSPAEYLALAARAAQQSGSD